MISLQKYASRPTQYGLREVIEFFREAEDPQALLKLAEALTKSSDGRCC